MVACDNPNVCNTYFVSLLYSSLTCSIFMPVLGLFYHFYIHLAVQNWVVSLWLCGRQGAAQGKVVLPKLHRVPEEAKRQVICSSHAAVLMSLLVKCCCCWVTNLVVVCDSAYRCRSSVSVHVTPVVLRSALGLLEFRTIDHAMQPVCNFITFLAIGRAGFSFCPLYGFHNIMSFFWYLCGVCFSCGGSFGWISASFCGVLVGSCYFSLDMSMGWNREKPGFFWAKITYLGRSKGKSALTFYTL